jgi:hypothetical protein
MLGLWLGFLLGERAIQPEGKLYSSERESYGSERD